MAKKPRKYRIVFHNQGKIYELYAHHVSMGELFGFVEIADIIFGERTATTPQGAAAQAKLCAKHGLEACFPGHAGADTVPLNGSVHGYYLKDEP